MVSELLRSGYNRHFCEHEILLGDSEDILEGSSITVSTST